MLKQFANLRKMSVDGTAEWTGKGENCGDGEKEKP